LNLFNLTFFNRFFLLLVIFSFTHSLAVMGCSSEPSEELKVTKRMKIEYPKKAPVKKAPKKTVKKKVVKTAKPDVKWVSPRKATIKKKSAAKPKPAPVKTAVAKKASPPAKKKASVSSPSAAKSGTNYVISLSSYRERGKAVALAGKVTSDGYNAYVTETVRNGTTWYRVRCGFFEGFTEATKVKDKLAKRYFAKGAWVDKPTGAEVAKYAK
jgi:cell division septation protein DedD